MQEVAGAAGCFKICATSSVGGSGRSSDSRAHHPSDPKTLASCAKIAAVVVVSAAAIHVHAITNASNVCDNYVTNHAEINVFEQAMSCMIDEM